MAGTRLMTMPMRPPQAKSTRTFLSSGKISTRRGRIVAVEVLGIAVGVIAAAAEQHAPVGGEAEIVEHEVAVGDREVFGIDRFAVASSKGSVAMM